MNDVVKEKLSLLKPVPGCYLMKNKDGNIIYVGKAKRLNKRVTSYFDRIHTGKTAKMVSQVCDFDIIVTNSDKEAFLLEINLIHLHNPIYNILLKDDRAYPYIELHLTEHPYLSIARHIKSKKSKYFGPYPDGGAARTILFLLNRLYPLRKCNHIPSKVCLYYHMHQCLGPCVNNITKQDYEPYINKITSFLNGNVSEIKKEITSKMNEASETLNFEEALTYKNMLDDIEHICVKQTIMIDDKFNADVIGYHVKDSYISISILMFRNGALNVKHNQVLSFVDDVNETLSSFLLQYYESNVVPKEVILPNIEDIDVLREILGCKVSYYSKGDKHTLIEMAVQNAVIGMEEKYMLSKQDEEKQDRINAKLEEYTGVKNIKTIELIDNSHLQGSNPVSAVVVFENGYPNKKKYRKYQINGENTKDDLASMYEVLYRRYLRKLMDNDELSDLLIVDGGENQIVAAHKAIDQLHIDMPIVGLVKNKSHSTEALLVNGKLINIKDDKDLLFFLTRMQDEVHRFVISYHKDKRSKSMLKSRLDGIEGLGDKRKEKLLKVYGDIDTIEKLSVDELAEYLPRNVALNVYNTFKK